MGESSILDLMLQDTPEQLLESAIIELISILRHDKLSSEQRLRLVKRLYECATVIDAEAWLYS